jgi:hypothetical protein
MGVAATLVMGAANFAMKSTDVYRVLRDAIGPWAKANGFARTKGGMLGFFRPEGSAFLVFWCQCSQDGWDARAGSKFTVELQLSSSDHPGAGGPDVIRRRLPALLGDADWKRILQMQSDMTRGVRSPSNGFLASFLRRVRPAPSESELKREAPRGDLWLPYHDEADVQRWGDLLVEILPSAISRMTNPDDSLKQASRSPPA